MLHAPLKPHVEAVCERAQKLLDEAETGFWRLRVLETYRSAARHQRLWEVGRRANGDGTWDVTSTPTTDERPQDCPLTVVDREGNPAALGAILVVTVADSGIVLPKGDMAWSVIPAASFLVAPKFFCWSSNSRADGPRLEVRGWKGLAREGVLVGRP